MSTLPPWVLRHAAFKYGTISLIDENLRTGRHLRRPYYLWGATWCDPLDLGRVRRGKSDPTYATGDKDLALRAFKESCKGAGLGRRVKPP